MPIGENTYKGLGVPLAGESEMRQISTLDMLTLTHSTANEGNFLVLRDNVPAGSTLVSQDVLRIGTGGSITGSPNSNPWLISSAGELSGVLQPTTTVTTAADKTLTQAESGTLIIVAANTDTSHAVLLPVNPLPGTWYDFYLDGEDALGDFTIKTTADSSAKISLVGLTSLVSTTDNITPLSTVPSGIHIVAVSSILWWARQEYAIAPAGSTNFTANDLILGLWGVGATAG